MPRRSACSTGDKVNKLVLSPASQPVDGRKCHGCHSREPEKSERVRVAEIGEWVNESSFQKPDCRTSSASVVSATLSHSVPVTLHRHLLLLVPLLLVLGGDETWGKSGDFQPYEADAHTLHLWHLDANKPPFADAVPDGTSLTGLLNGARANQLALPGLGHSISFHAGTSGTAGKADYAGAILTASDVLTNSTADNVPAGFRYFGADGAFTYEMVVKLDMLPHEAETIALGLLSMDGDGSDRVFNLRLEKDGFLAFIPLPHGGASGGGIASIPTSGPNAVDTHSWFHIAVTYDGNGGVTNNLKLYWTRLGEGVVTANRIGSGTLSSDFNGTTGDLAIGNEARSFPGNAESQPFPGLIDEVRISGVARHPSDFFFVPANLRINPQQALTAAELANQPVRFRLDLENVFVDSKAVQLALTPGKRLMLGSGLHRLDFDFGFDSRPLDSMGKATDAGIGSNAGNVKLRCQLEGIDERWQQTELGMSVICQALDDSDRLVSQSRFEVVGRSSGWVSTPEDSTMTRRVEPIYLPAGASKLKLILSSGSPDTTGFFVVDYIALHPVGDVGPSLWANEVFAYDESTNSPAGAPAGWQRVGGDPAIARMILRAVRPGIGLVDGDQSQFGDWTSQQTLTPAIRRSGTYSLSWYEAYNVIGGSTHRATYINVPPGNYMFRAIGLAGGDEPAGDELSLAILIHPPFWQQLWFWPAIAAGSVGLVAAAIFSRHRQRARRSLERLRFRNALESDRTRIARDMHDDLGSRVTFINMSAALAQRDIERAPENACRHLSKMTESTRELIVAMDDLVWAVDPAHDTLDHLASHLTRVAEEMFRDSSIRCRLDIPALLPALPLGSELRHHIALAVKEALHNVLCHAGPSEVFFSLAFNGEEIRITLRDTGVGFDPANDERGHGLNNLASRFKEIGGTCKIASSPGSGTCIVLICPVTASRRQKT